MTYLRKETRRIFAQVRVKLFHSIKLIIFLLPAGRCGQVFSQVAEELSGEGIVSRRRRCESVLDYNSQGDLVERGADYDETLKEKIICTSPAPPNHLDGVCFYLQSKSEGVTRYRYRTHNQAPFCLLPIS